MTSKGLLTEHQTSEATGFKVNTLRNRRSKELPPCYTKIGRNIFYYRKDIECYMDSGICYLIPTKPHMKEKYF
jgi:hypothetical protein